MHHAIKINRALRLAAIGRYPASARAMLAAIPASVVAALTAAQLAQMLDALWDACQASKTLAAREAAEAGALWVGDRCHAVAA